MKKSVILGVISAIALIMAIAFIFYNSSVDGKTSYKITSGISERIAERVVDGYSEMSEESRRKEVKKVDAVLRGVAHAAEFFILGFFVVLAVYAFGKNRVAALIIGVAACIIYAFFDEIHQLYVAGRIFDLADVIVDVAGGVAGSLVARLCIFARSKRN